jgi:hypothetical protein
MSRSASNPDAIVFPEALSQAGDKDQKVVAEKADQSVEAADLHASAGDTDMVNAAPTTPVTWRSMRYGARWTSQLPSAWTVLALGRREDRSFPEANRKVSRVDPAVKAATTGSSRLRVREPPVRFPDRAHSSIPGPCDFPGGAAAG